MSDSFTARYEPLISMLRAARAAGHEPAALQARGRLIDAYARLGRRETGTTEEQNRYIVGRRLGALPSDLVDVGIRADELPMPEARSSPALPEQRADSTWPSEDLARIADRFAHVGGQDEQPPERYAVHDRPDDNMRHLGQRLPFAVVDTHDNLPVGWYADRDLAETIAGTASRLRTAS